MLHFLVFIFKLCCIVNYDFITFEYNDFDHLHTSIAVYFLGGGEVADTKSFMYLSLIYTKISGKSVILLLIHRLTFFLETGLLEAFKI